MAIKKSPIKENRNPKLELKTSDDKKIGLVGADTKDDLIVRKLGTVPENGLLTESEEYILTEASEYLVWI